MVRSAAECPRELVHSRGRTFGVLGEHQVAAGTSTPTSMTVVAIRTSASPAGTPHCSPYFSTARMRPWRS